MTLTNIEKAAKLMGYEIKALKPINSNIVNHQSNGDLYVVDGLKDFWFNPYTNKADLSDVIDELGISVDWDGNDVYATSAEMLYIFGEDAGDHPNKFTAKAHAVMAVVEQIYDAKYGKDGE